MTEQQLWKKVRELEDKESTKLDDYHATKKYLMDIFGDKQTKREKIVSSHMSLYSMVASTIIYLEGKNDKRNNN